MQDAEITNGGNGGRAHMGVWQGDGVLTLFQQNICLSKMAENKNDGVKEVPKEEDSIELDPMEGKTLC